MFLIAAIAWSLTHNVMASIVQFSPEEQKAGAAVRSIPEVA